MRTLLIAALFALAPAVALAADEMPVYKVVAKDGVFEPTTIEVAAGK